ncbi:hypothetical protein D3C78_1905140 [compost metagenome]
MDQAVLVRVGGGVAAKDFDTGADVDAFAVQLHIATLEAVLLDNLPRGGLGLAAD